MYTYLFCLLFISLVISQPCTDCNSCATCSIDSWGDYQLVTVDSSACSINGVISHACCISANVGSDVDFCDLVLCDGLLTENNLQKCEGVGKSTFVVSPNITSITVQLRDGSFNGDYDCGGDGNPCCGPAGENYCSASGVSQTCQVTFNLTDCSSAPAPEPIECNEINCADLPCAPRSCRDTICKIDEFLPAEQVCRKSQDECDKPEYCEGHTATCPYDLRRDSTPGYALQCDDDIFLCGIPEKAVSESQRGHVSFVQDPDMCSLGRGELHKLRFPDCTMSCPDIHCPNYHVVTKYIVATCDATIQNANPWTCNSSYVLTDDDFHNLKTICPFNPANNQ